MKVAIMQPYFLPYIGYFQLIAAVDKFIIYDEIEYTKKGWINRNRILNPKFEAEYISIPLKKDSDYLFVSQRELSTDWNKTRGKLKNKIKASYAKAPHFNSVFPLVERILYFDSINLFEYILNSILRILEFLNIKTEIIISSSLNLNNALRSEQKVLEICKATSATHYINPIGGLELYEKGLFEENNIKLSFLKANDIRYKQFSNEFISFLSIIDILMFNDLSTINKMLTKEFTLV